MKPFLILVVTAALVAGCQREANNSWQGYIEGEYVMLASPYAGQLQKLYVRRGDLLPLTHFLLLVRGIMLKGNTLADTRVISVLVGRGSSEFEKKRQIYYWATGGGYYIVFMFVAAFLPMPRLGFGSPSSYGYVWDSWWQVPPHDVMAWGFLSFGALGLTKLFERPERIERSAEE